jgi:threonine dehydratase
MHIAREEIEQAYGLIRPHIRVTPVIHIDATDIGLAPAGRGGAPRVALKLEQLQVAGSFKARGAFTHMLTRTIPAQGVVAASGGNHGAAVAYAASRLGVPAKIFVPTVSSAAKVERIRACGADLSIIGDRYADAFAAAEAWAAASGAIMIHAFDQKETLLGQGTIGLELEAQAPDIETILVAVGGGGLIGGIAAWYAGRKRVVGVEPVDAPTLTDALRAGRPVDAPTGSIAADSLAPRRVGDLMFPIAQAHAPQVVLVTDQSIRDAQRALWEKFRLVAEPGGATAFAAVLSGAYTPAPGERLAIIISGGNTIGVTFGD